MCAFEIYIHPSIRNSFGHLHSGIESGLEVSVSNLHDMHPEFINSGQLQPGISYGLQAKSGIWMRAIQIQATWMSSSSIPEFIRNIKPRVRITNKIYSTTK